MSVLPFRKRPPQTDQVVRAIDAFESETAEVLHRAKPRFERGMLYVIGGMFVTLIFLSCVISLDRIAVAPGQLLPSAGTLERAAALKNIPILMVFGDNVDRHPRWVAYRKLDLDYASAVRAAGGKVDVINLPDLGIKGNSHMMMMDKNNGAVADVIGRWLVDQGLTTETVRKTRAKRARS